MMSLARAMPRAVEMAVEAWPVTQASQSLSSGRKKPPSPPRCLRVENLSHRPVSSLWA